MNLATALSVTYAERKRDAANGLFPIVTLWGERGALMVLNAYRYVIGSEQWRALYRGQVGRPAFDADRREMICQLVERLQAKSSRGTLPRTHFPDTLSIQSVVCHLLDANSIVAMDEDPESLSEALTALLATDRSPELKFMRIALLTRRAEVLEAIEYHHSCWMTSRECAA